MNNTKVLLAYISAAGLGLFIWYLGTAPHTALINADIPTVVMVFSGWISFLLISVVCGLFAFFL